MRVVSLAITALLLQIAPLTAAAAAGIEQDPGQADRLSHQHHLRADSADHESVSHSLSTSMTMSVPSPGYLQFAYLR